MQVVIMRLEKPLWRWLGRIVFILYGIFEYNNTIFSPNSNTSGIKYFRENTRYLEMFMVSL